MNRFLLPLLWICLGAILFSGVMGLTLTFKKCTTDYNANQLVAVYAEKKAKSADAKYSVTNCGEQVTPGGIRRRMYDITFVVGETTVVRRACVTVAYKDGKEKLVQFSSWPSAGGPIELHNISNLQAKL